jgi:hypothetical protein
LHVKIARKRKKEDLSLLENQAYNTTNPINTEFRPLRQKMNIRLLGSWMYAPTLYSKDRNKNHAKSLILILKNLNVFKTFTHFIDKTIKKRLFFFGIS